MTRPAAMRRPRAPARARLAGMTLIELVVFIVIAGILATLLAVTFGNMVADSPATAEITHATQLARERMELILGQRQVLGIDGFTSASFDPCAAGSTAPACTPVAGYTVSAALAGNWNGDTNYRVVTVTVTNAAGATLAQLQFLVADN